MRRLTRHCLDDWLIGVVPLRLHERMCEAMHGRMCEAMHGRMCEAMHGRMCEATTGNSCAAGCMMFSTNADTLLC